MNCPKCDTEVADESAFCHNCGAPIGPAVPSVAPEAPGRRRALLLGAGAGALAVAAAIVVVVLVVQPFGDGDGLGPVGAKSDEEQVAELLERQPDLFNKKDWQALYDLLSPRTRELCSYDEYLANVQGGMFLVRAFLGEGDYSVRDIAVTVQGDVAAANYIYQIGGSDAGVEEEDLFVKVEGMWYDIDDSGTLCPNSGEGNGAKQAPVTGDLSKTPTVPPPPLTSASGDIGLVQEVYRILQEDYVYPEAVTADLLEASTIDEMLRALGDPSTVYVDPESYSLGIDVVSGTFEGIGAQVAQHPVTGQIVIVTPYRDSPAANGGIRAGDVVRSVDGESTEGWTAAQSVRRIRGAAGTEVVLGIEHSDGSTEEVTITRGKIVIRTVFAPEIEDRAGNPASELAYIELQQFTDEAVDDLRDELQRLVDEGYSGIILDLRRNPGGGLNATVEAADLFLDEGVILTQLDRDGGEKVFRAESGDEAKDLPVVLLVGPGSASGSEVLACALRDNGRATLIGEHTFGRGSVNHLRELSDGGALYVTIARWECPSGDQIEAVGIDPDVKVVSTEADIEAARDVQLFAAIDHVRSRAR